MGFLDNAFYISDDKVRRQKPNAKHPRYEVSENHAQNICVGISSIKESLRRESANLSKEDMIMFLIRTNGKVDEGSVRKLGAKVLYCFDRNLALVSMNGYAFDEMEKKANRYRNHPEAKRNCKSLFKRLSELIPNDSPDRKIDGAVRDEMDSGKIFRCEILAISSRDIKDRSSLNESVQDGYNITILDELDLGGGQRSYLIETQGPVLDALASQSSVIDVSLENIAVQEPIEDPLDKEINWVLSDDVDIDTLPIIGILDGGIEMLPNLERIVVGHWIPEGLTIENPWHGTAVATRAAFGLINDDEENVLTPRFRIMDLCVYNNGHRTRDIAKYVKEAVKSHPEIKIFLININTEKPVNNHNDPLSRMLDSLSEEYHVLFINSMGNNDEYRGKGLRQLFTEHSSMIRSPSDAVLPLTIGAVAGSDMPDSVTRADCPSPYTCRGPGVSRVRKPDVVVRSGTVDIRGRCKRDVYSRLIASEGIDYKAGTSFGPSIAVRVYENLRTQLEDDRGLLTQAVLINMAKMPDWKSGNDIDPNDLLGHGLIHEGMVSEHMNNEVLMVREGSIEVGEEEIISIAIPEGYKEMDRQRRDRFKVSVTCVSDSRVDRTKGANCVRSYIKLSANKNETDDGGNNSNIYSPRFKKLFSIDQISDDSWEFKLTAKGEDEMKGKMVEYALAVSIMDPMGIDLKSFYVKSGAYKQFVGLKKTERPSIRPIIHNQQ